MSAPTLPRDETPRRNGRAGMAAAVSLALGVAAGAAGGKALLVLYFTFWFITMGGTVLLLGILFWVMVLLKRARRFAFLVTLDILLFHAGMVLGLFLVGA